MGSVTIWWCGRSQAPRQHRYQAVNPWRLRGVAVGISLLLLALVATVAYGQRLLITPSFSIEERYDDNIFETTTDRQDDFITVLSPGIRAQYLAPEPTLGSQVDLDYRADVQFFAEHSSQNDVAHRLSLIVDTPLAPSLGVRLRDLFRVTEDPFGRTERLSDPTGLRPASDQQRARTIRNEAEGRVDVRLGGRFSLGMLLGNLVEDVDVPEELDEFRYTVGTELGYVVNVARDSRVVVSYQVTFENFRTNGNVPQGDSDASFRIHAISTGIRHELTPTLAMDAGIGYSFTSSDEPQNDGHTAVIANAGLTKTYSIGRAFLGYRRNFSSGEGQGGVIIADTISVSASANLTGKLTARLDGNVSWFNFQDVQAGTLDQDQRFWSIRPSLTYQILRPWSVLVEYAYEDTNFADNTTADRSTHRLLLGTQFALREWLTLGLSYRYASRQMHGNSTSTTTVGVEEFSRNQVMLSLTARPTLRF